MNSNELVKVIAENTSNRFILGIDGLSRSGKTTLVKQLEDELKQKDIPFHIFHIDDHIVERSKRYNTKHEEWYEYYQLQWDVEWLQQHLFHKLRLENQLNLPFYDHQTDFCEMREVIIPSPCVIVIEGVFLQRKEWREYFDYMVYLDYPREQRFLRENEETQKNLLKFEHRYWKAEDFYLKVESPQQNADLVLKG
ncbi:kinase [Bacillus pseudomycoides]|uniref:Uridine kinase n=1 Tax=Bacillus pseudomycoides TaxID=64104 RepID=A0A2C3PSG1_9BACI|nr:kinase [Bacillus pseudomycoides]PEA80928.1 uridine kinase [Bacillus pseudomycoides]PED05546.1 uridine kinase [Bacillus pseudomycoides]PEI96896.1 uridine kinase [Bacillus pseudomycoides]PEK23513.1 uridine kinase [Bacillus pseudomycoides]PEM64375.1 uridine kinase [Bacillus pseudomycoides]